MVVYLVNSVCDTEYGCTEVAGVYSTLEKAQAYVDENQDTWVAWWDDKEHNTLTITEEKVL